MGEVSWTQQGDIRRSGGVSTDGGDDATGPDAAALLNQYLSSRDPIAKQRIIAQLAEADPAALQAALDANPKAQAQFGPTLKVLDAMQAAIHPSPDGKSYTAPTDVEVAALKDAIKDLGKTDPPLAQKLMDQFGNPPVVDKTETGGYASQKLGEDWNKGDKGKDKDAKKSDAEKAADAREKDQKNRELFEWASRMAAMHHDMMMAVIKNIT